MADIRCFRPREAADDAGTRAGSPVSCTNCTTGIFNSEYLAINLGPQALYLTFGGSLSAGSEVVLSLRTATQSNQAQYQGRPVFDAVTGAAVAVVPEPVTWAMMMLGFGMVAGATRYRRKSLKVSII